MEKKLRIKQSLTNRGVSSSKNETLCSLVTFVFYPYGLKSMGCCNFVLFVWDGWGFLPHESGVTHRKICKTSDQACFLWLYKHSGLKDEWTCSCFSAKSQCFLPVALLSSQISLITTFFCSLLSAFWSCIHMLCRYIILLIFLDINTWKDRQSWTVYSLWSHQLDICLGLSSQGHPEGWCDVSRPSKEDPQQRADDAGTDEPDSVSGGLTLPNGAEGANKGGQAWRMDWVFFSHYSVSGRPTRLPFIPHSPLHFPLSSSYPLTLTLLPSLGSAVESRGKKSPRDEILWGPQPTPLWS